MANAPYRRHDMLMLWDDSLDYAREMAAANNPNLPHTLIGEVICAPVPAIVKMQEQVQDGFLEVGFSSHLYYAGNRVRLKSVIPTRGIRTIITPLDIIPLIPSLSHTHIRGALEALSQLAHTYGITLGLYGSCALELLTQRPYITPQSDIDICVRASGHSNYAAFYTETREIAQAYKVHFDIEAICADGVGVKLAELLSKQKTVLCKGLYGVELRDRQSLIF